MRKRRRYKSTAPAGVELNMAAMLDMAFQLLAFFILTFHPSPIEAQISMRMPSENTTAGSGVQVDPDIGTPAQSLSIQVLSTPDGELSGIEIGTQALAGSGNAEADLLRFQKMLQESLKGTRTVSMVIEFAEDLRYERMIQVLDICAAQAPGDGETITDISITTLKMR